MYDLDQSQIRFEHISLSVSFLQIVMDSMTDSVTGNVIISDTRNTS